MLYNNYFNHYLKYDSTPTQISDWSTQAERDSAKAVRALASTKLARIRTAVNANFDIKLNERANAYKKAIAEAIDQNCEMDCARRARQKAVEAFGRERVENAHRLSRSAQTVLRDFIDDRKRNFIVESKIKGAVKWNTYMTEGIRMAEQNLLELVSEYDSHRQEEVIEKVKTARAAAEDARIESVMDGLRNKVAQAGTGAV